MAALVARKKRRVALRECEEGPKPAAAAGRQQSKLGPPPAASVPPDPLDVVGSSFQVRPTAVRLLPCTSTRSGCLFPCHLASPGSGERGLLPAFLPSGENRADQSRESGLGWDSKRLRREHFLSPLADAGWHISARIRRPLSPTAPRPPLCLSGLVAFSLQWPFCFGQARVDRSRPCSKVRRT